MQEWGRDQEQMGSALLMLRAGGLCVSHHRDHFSKAP